MSELHREILLDGQSETLTACASFLNDSGAVLAGGLSLALRFGHRRSGDMDWFLPGGTATDDLATRIAAVKDVTLVGAEPGTIHGHWSRTPFSIIRYRYHLGTEHLDGLPIADLRTVTGMKLLAALNRGTRRDLIDIATCLDHGMDLQAMLEQATQDIPGLTTESLLRALAYYEDAECEPDPEGMPATAWQQAKSKLANAIRDCLEKEP